MPKIEPPQAPRLAGYDAMLKELERPLTLRREERQARKRDEPNDAKGGSHGAGTKLGPPRRRR